MFLEPIGTGKISSHFCWDSGAAGKMVADAQHAAVALENGCTWVTRDADFEMFRRSGLRVELLMP